MFILFLYYFTILVSLRFICSFSFFQIFAQNFFDFFITLSYFVVSLSSLLNTVLLLITVLLCVAWFTVYERKLLASTQRRRGPNVVGFWGVLQAFADALKLLIKEPILPTNAHPIVFKYSPVFVLVAALLGWAVMPYSTAGSVIEVNLGLYFLLAAGSLSALGIFYVGWSSGSRYALLGGIRAAAQMISYEVIFAFLFFPMAMLVGSVNITTLSTVQVAVGCFSAFLAPFVFLMFLCLILAETNRAPFDLPEAESELVAGYGVEFASSGFTMLFLAEYSGMLLMSSLGAHTFIGGFGKHGSAATLAIKVLCFCTFIVGVRALLPRYRYDQLMKLCWTRFLLIITIYTYISSYIALVFGYGMSTLDTYSRSYYKVRLDSRWFCYLAGIYAFEGKKRLMRFLFDKIAFPTRVGWRPTTPEDCRQRQITHYFSDQFKRSLFRALPTSFIIEGITDRMLEVNYLPPGAASWSDFEFIYFLRNICPAPMLKGAQSVHVLDTDFIIKNNPPLVAWHRLAYDLWGRMDLPKGGGLKDLACYIYKVPFEELEYLGIDEETNTYFEYPQEYLFDHMITFLENMPKPEPKPTLRERLSKYRYYR